jgi:hypothetical protein
LGKVEFSTNSCTRPHVLSSILDFNRVCKKITRTVGIPARFLLSPNRRIRRPPLGAPGNCMSTHTSQSPSSHARGMLTHISPPPSSQDIATNVPWSPSVSSSLTQSRKKGTCLDVGLLRRSNARKCTFRNNAPVGRPHGSQSAHISPPPSSQDIARNVPWRPSVSSSLTPRNVTGIQDFGLLRRSNASKCTFRNNAPVRRPHGTQDPPSTHHTCATTGVEVQGFFPFQTGFFGRL